MSDRTIPEDGGFALPSPDGAPIVRERAWHASLRSTVQYMGSAVRSLSVNRLRAGLTMLGILIGVAAVIALVSIGQGAKADVQARIEGLRTNLINVTPDQSRTWGRAAGNRLTWRHAELIRESVPSAAGVAPEVAERTSVRYGRETRTYEVVGTTADFATMRDWNVAFGRFLTEADVRARTQVVVLGNGVADDLFGFRGPIGSSVRIAGAGYEVVGVLEERGGRGFQNPDNRVYIPVTTAIRRVTGNDQVRSIAVQVDDRANMQTAALAISETLRSGIGRNSDGSDAFLVTTQDDVLSTMQEVTRTLTALLASIAGISLVVGGIGIMNIMLVSVSERTREIGIRKAVGARRGDVLVQFLSEAVLLSAAGGALGWLLGTAAARVVTTIIDVPTIVSVETILVAVGFSAFVGVLFGWYPAKKAAALDPIDALCYE